MIPPTMNEPGLDGNGASETATQNNGQTPGTLVPYESSSLPAEMSRDWGYDPAGWGADDTSGQGFKPMDFVHSLRRRWILASGLSIGISLAVMATVFIMVPVTHVATLLMLVHSSAPGFDFDRRMPTPAEVRRLQATARAQAKSPKVLQALLRPTFIQDIPMIYDEAADRERFLHEELRTGFVKDSEIMYFSLTGENRKDLITIVDEWYVAFVKEVVSSEKRDLVTERERVRTVFGNRVDELREARESLRIQYLNIGASTPEDARQQLMLQTSRLNLLAAERREAERNFFTAEQAYQLAKSLWDARQRGEIDPRLIEEFLSRDRVYQDLKGRAVAALNYYEEQAGPVSQQGRREPPAIRQIRESATAAQVAVTRYKRNFERDYRKQIRNSPLEKRQLNDLLGQYRNWQKRKQSLNEEYDELYTKIQSQRTSSVDLEEKQGRVQRLMTEVDEEAVLLAQLNRRVEQPPRVQKIQPADVPVTPNRFVNLIIVLGSGFLSICLTLAAVGGWEFTKQRISTSAEVSKRIGLPLIGTLPVLPERSVGQLLGGASTAQLESILGDSIDSIRTALIHGAGNDGHRLILVTSAWDGEGKTTIASQLAASLARCGRRTLLVDGDLRSPTLHHLFELPQEQGLSEVLRGEVDVENAIRPTPAEGLKLLGAGHCDYASIQALENDNLGQLFDRLRSLYDFVIIDSPPILAFADSLLMGQYVDGAVLSLKLDVSQRPRVEEARDRLKTMGIHLYGGVINGVKVATSHRAFERNLPAAAAGPETETA